MVKVYKKYKFIPKEKLTKLFNVYDLNFAFTSSVLKGDLFVKTGYAQYSIKEISDRRLDLRLQKLKDGDVERVLPNKKFKELLLLKEMKSYKKYNKVKPIYKIMDSDKIPVDYNGEFPEGQYLIELIGILIK